MRINNESRLSLKDFLTVVDYDEVIRIQYMGDLFTQTDALYTGKINDMTIKQYNDFLDLYSVVSATSEDTMLIIGVLYK